MNKALIAFLLASLVAHTSLAIDETPIKPDITTNEANSPLPVSTPAVNAAPMAMEVPSSPLEENNNTATTPTVEPVSIPPLTRDTAEVILNNTNSQDPVRVLDLFVRDNFVYITQDGKKMSSITDIGGYLNAHSDKMVTYNIASISDVASGAALVEGQFSVSSAQDQHASANGTFTMNCQYNGQEWKIKSLQLTNAPVEAHDHADCHGCKGCNWWWILSLTFGLVIGFIGAKLIKRKEV